ncbi:PCNA-associated factor-like [Saccoglossus kowalevskii]|uniref:PCNA-associated factor n=1 Tax=Saccoglossus kowalevskii TaxID=10224 RepID=A0ABM0GJQ6_SACKO|nr:PREDICTED: PCNA-associated factor-like [Saccoglossus kowalevskii]
MVRTKADGCGRKAVAAKAPRKALSSSSQSASFASPGKAGAKNAGGGNPVCVRPTPSWQKGMGNFITTAPSKSKSLDKENEVPDDMEGAGCSSAQDSCMKESSTETVTPTKNNIIESDDDDD